MVHRAVPDEELDAVADELVATLAGSATVALGLAKWLLNTGATKSLEDHLHDEAFSMELSSRSEDFKEGLAVFKEKRPPEYRGAMRSPSSSSSAGRRARRVGRGPRCHRRRGRRRRRRLGRGQRAGGLARRRRPGRPGRDPSGAPLPGVRGLGPHLRPVGPGRRHLARRLRRPRPPTRCRPRRGVGAGAVQPRDGSTRSGQPGRPGAVRLRHRGAAPALPPADGPQRRGLVPALQRAGRRLRSGVARLPGRA